MASFALRRQGDCVPEGDETPTKCRAKGWIRACGRWNRRPREVRWERSSRARVCVGKMRRDAGFGKRDFRGEWALVTMRDGWRFVTRQ